MTLSSADLSGTTNSAIGYKALFSNTFGNFNTAVGNYTLLFNIDGTGNTAIGHVALRTNTSGSNNTAVGSMALTSNTGGIFNTAVGHEALDSNTTGSRNSANGFDALGGITTGNYNLGEGFQAGSYLSDHRSENQTSSNSVYLGANTKAGADGNTNEIVIGYDATGNGSNSVTLGNASITNTVLRGDVRHYGSTSGYVGIKAPAAVPTPWSLTLPAAAPTTNGQVLSSNTSGDMSWITPASGTVTSVTGTAPIVSTGGTTPAISISAATTSAAGSMSAADKTKLEGIAPGAEVNVNADWNAISGDAQILNKPSLFSGSYNDLTNKPLLFSGSYNDLTGKPSLSAVATSGKYSDLTGTPDLSKYATKDMGNQKIINMADPTNSQDAATKAYVDNLLAKIKALEAVVEASLLSNGFTDPRDKTHYHVVKIGNQIWMADNLRYLPSVAKES